VAALRGAAAQSPFYLVVEKILASHEALREDWPVDGTTGYEFLNQVNSLLIDAGAEQAFSDCYRQFTGEQRDFAEIGRLSKLHIMDHEMAGELNVLARDVARLARQNPRTADFTQPVLSRAIKQLIACFPVYRTYMDGSATLAAAGRRDLDWALAQARRYETELDPSAFDFLEQVLTGRLIDHPHNGYSRVTLLRCATRLQQYSGPVAAKGLEDTAFYRYNRFIALNEVGGDPHRFGGTIAAFHRATQFRAQHWPHAMLTTATHDTKRGEDTRARLAALSEYPEDWARNVLIWSRIVRGPDSAAQIQPDRNDEYWLYQQLLGSWPAEQLEEPACSSESLAEFGGRVREAARKSMREARVHTSWAFPDAAYENAMMQLIDTALTGARADAFLPAFLPFARRVAATGVRNSLVQTALKLTTPGVPDTYNGADLWDLSMVDPDNRRAVDYAMRAGLLRAIDVDLQDDRARHMAHWLTNWPDGRIKLALIVTLLRHRREQPALYADGDYQPLPSSGPRAEEIGAFARTHGSERVIIAFARFPRRQELEPFDGSTVLPLTDSFGSGDWLDLLSGRRITADSRGFSGQSLFALLPVAVLTPA
jgi:(1->4)-alpha-D-glucan 1-alpha-D-glucosylmutase